MDLIDISVPGRLNSSFKFQPNLDFLPSLRSQRSRKPTAPAGPRQPRGRRLRPTRRSKPNPAAVLARLRQTQPCHPSLPLLRRGWQSSGAPPGEEAGQQATEPALKGRAAGRSRLCGAQLVPRRRTSQVSVLVCSLQTLVEQNLKFPLSALPDEALPQ